MATFLFLVANILLLALNIYAAVIGYAAVGFSTAVLWVAAALTGKVTNNTNIAVFWGTIGMALVFAGLGALGLIR